MTDFEKKLRSYGTMTGVVVGELNVMPEIGSYQETISENLSNEELIQIRNRYKLSWPLDLSLEKNFTIFLKRTDAKKFVLHYSPYLGTLEVCEKCRVTYIHGSL